MLISNSWDTSCANFLCGYSTAIPQAPPSAEHTHGPGDAVPGSRRTLPLAVPLTYVLSFVPRDLGFLGTLSMR